MVYVISPAGNIKKIYFGAAGMSDYTIHKDPERRERYLARHARMSNENWSLSGINTPGFWSRWYLWEKTTTAAALQYIREHFLKHLKNHLD